MRPLKEHIGSGRKISLGIIFSLLFWAAPAGAAVRNFDGVRQQAVALARQNQFDKALPMFQQLLQEGDRDPLFWGDYLTVLSWKGDYAQMVSLADAYFPDGVGTLPDYALLPMAKAYTYVGRIDDGNKLYALLGEKNSGSGDKEADLLVEQALDAMNRKDYVEAEGYFSRAKTLLAGRKNGARDLDARRAALYIRSGEAGRAVRILKPYADSRTATPHMFSDYLAALRGDNQAKQAVKAFHAYGKDWSGLPSYGLETMGDLYLRAGDFGRAHEIYGTILSRGDTLPYVQLGDAYACAMLGKEKRALSLYQQVLSESKYSPRMENAAAADGAAYLQSGKLTMARKTFGLLGKNPEEKEQYQLQYGKALVGANGDLNSSRLNFRRDMLLGGRDYTYEARKVLEPLTRSKNPDVALSARTALVKNTLNEGRYASAEKQLDGLFQSDNDAPEVLATAAENDTRLEHSAGTYYSSRLDNKRNHESDVGVNYGQYLGDNLSLDAGWEYRRLQDGRLHASYHQESAGLSWKYARGEMGAAYAYFGSDWKNGYNAYVNYDFNDVTSAGFSLGRRPHDAAGAVNRHITEDYKSISLDSLISDRLKLSLGYEWADLSDDNRYWGMSLSGNYGLSQKHNYYDSLPFVFGRSHYRRRSDYYDSPGRSNYYGLGWRRQWNIDSKERYWAWTNMLGGGHDDNEREGFSPSTRLELIQDLPKNQRLRAAAQYNWYFHQDPDAAWNRRNNGYLFELSYEIGW